LRLEAANYGEARALLDDASLRIDVVLADIQAPEQEAFLFYSWLRRVHPDVELLLSGMWNFCFLGPSPRLHKMPENSAKKGQRLLSLQIIIWYSTAYAAHWLQETAGGAESGTNPKPHLVRCGEHAARWRLAAAAPSRGPRKLRDAFETT